MTRVAVLTGLIVAVAMIGGAATWAAKWSTGGDQGRSGLHPQGAGKPPFEPLWSMPVPAGHGKITSPLLITNPGSGQRAPRVVFGTTDGNVHLFDLYTGQRVGEDSGVPLSQSHDFTAFSGFGGAVGFTDSSSPQTGLGQLFVVYNDTDQANPYDTDPDTVHTNDVALAQIDVETGRLVQDVPIPGTDEYKVSSTPVLSEPRLDGRRDLLFTVVDDAGYADEYLEEDPTSPNPFAEPPSDPKAAPKFMRLTIERAHTTATDIHFDENRADGTGPESQDRDYINPLASPALFYLRDQTAEPGPEPVEPTPYATISTADPDTPISTWRTDGFLFAGPEPILGLFDESGEGPSVSRLDREVSFEGKDLLYTQTAAFPVSRAGLPPGAEGSELPRAFTFYVASYRPKLDRTYVHRIALSPDGGTALEVARSKPFRGKPVTELALTSTATRTGIASGRVILATDRNLYALRTGDLRTAWQLDPADALLSGSTGFTRSRPAVIGSTVLIARDNGQPLALDVDTGDVLGDAALRLDPAHAAATTAAPGPPAIAQGIVVFATDTGVFAYRSACGNELRGSNQNEALLGTRAGDKIDALLGNDTVTSQEGGDCVDGGAGDDVVDAGEGDDDLIGGIGDDRLMGAAGADRLDGDAGVDILLGEDGVDQLTGGGGEDLLKGGNGEDLLEGGEQNDRLSGNADNDTVGGGPGRDHLKGNAGDDTLSGGSSADKVDGGEGADVVIGNTGPDELYGRQGDDRLEAVDASRDEVVCGSGIDTAIVDRRDVVRGCEIVQRQSAVAARRARARWRAASMRVRAAAAARRGGLR